MTDNEVHAAHAQRGLGSVQPTVGWQQARVGIDPRRQLNATGFKPPPRGVGVKVFLARRVRQDGSARRFEGLQTVNVVSVEVGDDDGADRLARDAANGGDEIVRQRGLTQCIDHDHAVAGDHETRVGDEIAVGAGAQRCFTLRKPDRRRNLAQLQSWRGGMGPQAKTG